MKAPYATNGKDGKDGKNRCVFRLAIDLDSIEGIEGMTVNLEMRSGEGDDVQSGESLLRLVHLPYEEHSPNEISTHDGS